MTPGVYIEVHEHPHGGTQVSITTVTHDGVVSGYRLAGPKYDGTSRLLVARQLTQRDANEIRDHLDQEFPREQAERRSSD